MPCESVRLLVCVEVGRRRSGERDIVTHKRCPSSCAAVKRVIMTVKAMIGITAARSLK